jgi:hypothetical protein
MSGCNEKVKSNVDAVTYSRWLETATQDEVHKILGEPTGTLSGFWGDIYHLVNGTKIFIYYDATGKVEYIKTYDKDGNEIKSTDVNDK